MLYIVTGGSGSGKSEYAERLAVDMHRNGHADGKLYYVATMYPYDEECLKRIDRHRKMRREKGFSTIECYCGLSRLKAGRQDVLLLECMSNLLANEMYMERGGIKKRGEEALQQLAQEIILPVLALEKVAGAVVVVTNEVFSDGAEYGEETELYVKLLGKINERLGAEADGVAEVVCSIPVCQKGELLC